jgi:hypothetical protein
MSAGIAEIAILKLVFKSSVGGKKQLPEFH